MDEIHGAHDACFRNRDAVLRSELCGCFFCLAIFPPSEIEEWCDDDETAICPHCDIDSVLPSATNAIWATIEFLREMQRAYFPDFVIIQKSH
jgi:hypothetical protein